MLLSCFVFRAQFFYFLLLFVYNMELYSSGRLDGGGAVVVNVRMETSAPGIMAAGDIRSGSIRQVIAAAGDGAVAAISAERYISGQG